VNAAPEADTKISAAQVLEVAPRLIKVTAAVAISLSLWNGRT